MAALRTIVQQCSNSVCNSHMVDANRPLKLCSGCRTAKYCSVECQTQDWNIQHNKKCVVFANEKEKEREKKKEKKPVFKTSKKIIQQLGKELSVDAIYAALTQISDDDRHDKAIMYMNNKATVIDGETFNNIIQSISSNTYHKLLDKSLSECKRLVINMVDGKISYIIFCTCGSIKGNLLCPAPSSIRAMFLQNSA